LPLPETENAYVIKLTKLTERGVTVCLRYHQSSAISPVFWDITPRRCVSSYRHFRGNCCLVLQGLSSLIIIIFEYSDRNGIKFAVMSVTYLPFDISSYLRRLISCTFVDCYYSLPLRILQQIFLVTENLRQKKSDDLLFNFLSLADYRRSDACQVGRFRPTSSRKMA